MVTISLYIMIILWLISPVVLIPWVIVLFVKHNNLKRKFEELSRGQQPKEESREEPRVQKLPSPPLPQPLLQPSVQKPITNTVPVILHKKEGNAVNATLVTGVLFVLAAGIIFATTTWRVMPDFVKVLLVSSLAILFFAVSFFAEIKLKLRMTGIAFYHLGCLFVPVAILAIGYFQLFGGWFSLYGSGRYWLQLVMAMSFGILTVFGYRRYHMLSFYYVSWAASFCALWLLSRGIGNNWSRSWLWQTVYGTGIITWAILKKKRNRLLYVHPLFVGMCILQALFVYCGDFSFGVTLYSFCLLAAFAFYRLSGCFLAVSFDTWVSRWFFPSMVILGALIQSADGQFTVSTFLYLAAIACLVQLFLASTYKMEKCGISWLITVTGGFLFFPVLKLLTIKTGLESEVGYVAVFTLVIAVMLAGKLWAKGRHDSSLFKHPANGLTAFFTLLGLICFGVDGAGIWLLWEILILWAVLWRSYVYAAFGAILMLILPSLTLWTLHLDIDSMYYWIIMAVVGLIYQWSVCFKKMDSYYCSMFRVCGVSGLYIGFFLCCTLYFWLYSNSVMGGCLLLLFIAAVDVCGLRRYGNLDSSGIYIMLIPIISILAYNNFYQSNNFLLSVALGLAVIMMLVGRKLFGRMLEVKKEEGRTICQIDYLGICSISAFVLVCMEMTQLWFAAAMIFLGLWFLNWFKRQNERVDQVSVVCTVLSVYSAVIILTFGEISTEIGWLLISGIGLFCCVLSYKRGLEYGIRTVLQISGLLGLYAGFFVSASIYLLNPEVLISTGIFLLMVICAADILGIYKRDSLKYSLINLGIIPLISRYIIYCYPKGEVNSRVAAITAGILMMAGGRILFSKMFTVIKDENKTGYEADFLGLASLCGNMVTFHHGDIWTFAGLLYAAVWSFNWYHRQSRVFDHISWIAVLAFLFGAWVKQPFFLIPDLYRIEYYFLALLLTCAASAAIWKDKKAYLDIYWLVIGICFAVIQGIDCLAGESLWDVIFLGIVMLFVLFMAYLKRELRWLCLSLTTLTALVLYASRSFWMNIAWWVYLLMAGLLLIGIAAFHEYKKRDGGSLESKWKAWKW